MSTVGEFPAVCAAIKEICSDNDLSYDREVAALDVPGAFEQTFVHAEEAARRMRGISISDFLLAGVDVGNIELVCENSATSPDEDALLVFAVGEYDVRQALKRGLERRVNAHAGALDEILESAFDGSLRKYWARKHAP